MSIYEYDQARHIRQEREDAWEEGRKEGIKKGREEGIQEGRKAGIQEGRAEGISIGRTEGIRELITRKMEKGKVISEIAQDLEMEEEEIYRLIRQ